MARRYDPRCIEDAAHSAILCAKQQNRTMYVYGVYYHGYKVTPIAPPRTQGHLKVYPDGKLVSVRCNLSTGQLVETEVRYTITA